MATSNVFKGRFQPAPDSLAASHAKAMASKPAVVHYIAATLFKRER